MDLRPLMSHDDESNLKILFNIWEISEGWSFYGSMVSIDTYERNSIEFFRPTLISLNHVGFSNLCQKCVSDSNYNHGITLRSSQENKSWSFGM